MFPFLSVPPLNICNHFNVPQFTPKIQQNVYTRMLMIPTVAFYLRKHLFSVDMQLLSL